MLSSLHCQFRKDLSAQKINILDASIVIEWTRFACAIRVKATVLNGLKAFGQHPSRLWRTDSIEQSCGNMWLQGS